MFNKEALLTSYGNMRTGVEQAQSNSTLQPEKFSNLTSWYIRNCSLLTCRSKCNFVLIPTVQPPRTVLVPMNNLGNEMLSWLFT